MNKKRRKCVWCGKLTTKLAIIADDLENPRPYHTKCLNELKMKVIMDMSLNKE